MVQAPPSLTIWAKGSLAAPLKAVPPKPHTGTSSPLQALICSLAHESALGSHTQRGAYLDTLSAVIYKGASRDPASKHHVPNVQAAAPRGYPPIKYQSRASVSIQKQRH